MKLWRRATLVFLGAFDLGYAAIGIWFGAVVISNSLAKPPAVAGTLPYLIAIRAFCGVLSVGYVVALVVIGLELLRGSKIAAGAHLMLVGSVLAYVFATSGPLLALLGPSLRQSFAVNSFVWGFAIVTFISFPFPFLYAGGIVDCSRVGEVLPGC